MKTMNSRPVIHADRYLLIDDSMQIHQAKSYVINIRVEWSGDATLGTLDVLNTSGSWESCGHLEPELASNDLIIGAPTIIDEPFEVHIERSHLHGTCPFEAWARATQWTPEWQAKLTRNQLMSDFTAMRESPMQEGHYLYYGAEKDVPRTPSALVGNVQTVKLVLDPGFDWELWISLSHPTIENVARVQDPVIRPGDRNGTPAINE